MRFWIFYRKGAIQMINVIVIVIVQYPVSLLTARESYGRRLSFQEFWPLISDEPPSLSLKAGTKAHTQKMAKWPRVKLKKTMWVKKVVEALGDSWQGHPTTVSS